MGIRLAVGLAAACAVALGGGSGAAKTIGVAQAVAAPSCGLTNTWADIARSATGTVAAAVRHVETGALISFHGETPLLMQSVFKVPIALAVLNAVDDATLRLDASIPVGLRDLSPGVSPIAERARRDGPQSVALRELLRSMIVESDNSAADLLLRQVGGPPGVAQYLAGHQLPGIDVSLSERQNAEIYFDLPFPADAADPLVAFSQAVDAEPAARRSAAAKAYSRDRRNTATADALVAMLARVEQGTLVSPASTAMLLGWMRASTSFPGRMKGQLPAGAAVAHKTGTSGTTDGVTAVTNDAGLITLPDGSHLALAIFIKDSADASARRDEIIARIARAAYDCWTPRSVGSLLDHYRAGEFSAAVEQAAGVPDLVAFGKAYPREAQAWIALDANDLPRRRLVAAAFVLEVSAARIERDFRGWSDLSDAIEWGCTQLRLTSPPVAGEAVWQRASVALALRAGAASWLIGGPGGPGRPAVRHLSHAEDRFPDDPRFELARIMMETRPADDDLAMRARRRQPKAVAIAGAESIERIRTKDAISEFSLFTTDPIVGADAEVHVAHLYFEMYDYENALAHGRRAVSIAPDAEAAYQGDMLEGLALERLKRPAEAAPIYVDALNVFPGGQSAALALSSWLVLGGDVDRADALVESSLAAHARDDDPWRTYAYGDYMRWSKVIDELHTALR